MAQQSRIAIEQVEGTWQVRGPAATAATVMFTGTRRAEDAMRGDLPASVEPLHSTKSRRNALSVIDCLVP